MGALAAILSVSIAMAACSCVPASLPGVALEVGGAAGRRGLVEGRILVGLFVDSFVGAACLCRLVAGWSLVDLFVS